MTKKLVVSTPAAILIAGPTNSDIESRLDCHGTVNSSLYNVWFKYQQEGWGDDKRVLNLGS